MQNNQFELAVAKLRDGRSVKIREYGRQGLTLIEGKKGQPYSVIFRNNTPNRVMAIISVDGLDVVDGKPATAESRGYVVEGYASAEIKGWRTSTSEVRQFFFEDKQGSYSAGTTGETANCGVIACKVFAEKAKPLPVYVPPTVIREEHHYHHHDWPYVRPPWKPDIFWCSTAGQTGSIGASGPTGVSDTKYTCCVDSLAGETLKCANMSHPGVSVRECDQSSQPPEFNLGTGWGAAMTDCVNLTSFDKAYEMASMAIYYTNADALQKMGIELDKEVAVMSLPQGFGGFCQPPKGIR